MTYSDNISKKQVARMVGVSESTIVRWVKAKKFPLPYTIGGRTFYYKPEVETWLEKKREERGFQKIFSDLKQNLKEDFLIHNLKFEKEEKP